MNDAPRCATPGAPSKAMRLHVLARLIEAQARAVVRGAPVLVRLHTALSDCDPWALRARCGQPDSASFLWNDGKAELCAAAWGNLAWHPLSGESPFATAQAHCVTLLEQVFEIAGMQAAAGDAGGIDTEAPLAFAAFAFDAVRAQETAWGPLSGGALFVPSRLIYRRPTSGQPHAHAILSTEITADCDVPAQAQALCDDWATLFAAAPSCRQASDASGRARAGKATGAMASPPGAESPKAAQALWAARVRRAQTDMADGLIAKVVLARQRAVDAPEGQHYDAAATALALRAQHPSAITYAVSRGDGRSFLGATPEVLVRVRGRELDTQAVAGTAPRSASPDEDAALGAALLGSAKDQHEHAVVADSLAEDLAPVCIEVTRAPKPRLIRLPRLQHLETPFRATLRQVGGVLPLCARLHPTPATGGWPRRQVRAWLQAHEPLDRGLFAGPIGWLTAGGDGTFAVALRSMLLTPTRTLTFAGAGIVPASEPSAEWREIDLKLTTAQDALRLMPAQITDEAVPCAR